MDGMRREGGFEVVGWVEGVQAGGGDVDEG